MINRCKYYNKIKVSQKIKLCKNNYSINKFNQATQYNNNRRNRCII